MKKWQIGAVSGLIAGIVGGIVFTLLINFTVSIGFHEPQWRAMLLNQYAVNILVGIIWGAILGTIYSKTYNLIPSEGILKGLWFGLFLYAIMDLRQLTFASAYGWVLMVAGFSFSGFFKWMVYGLILGFLYVKLHVKYNIPKEKKKIIQYDWKGGLHPGAIAGLIGGIVSSIATVAGPILGVFKIPGTLFEFWLSQIGTHIFINLIWGTIFGAIFAKVFNLVPGKGIVKGLYYSFIVISISTFQWGSYWMGWGLIWSTSWGFFVGSFNIVAFGLVLGLLYRKPNR